MLVGTYLRRPAVTPSKVLGHFLHQIRGTCFQAEALPTTSTSSETATAREEEGAPTPTCATSCSHRLGRGVSENLPTAICNDSPTTKSPKIPATEPSSHRRAQNSYTSSAISCSLCSLLFMTPENISKTFKIVKYMLSHVCISNPDLVIFHITVKQGRQN